MQENSEDSILSHIRSKKLKHFLEGRPDILRTLTPPRSNLSQSGFHVSGPLSFDYFHSENNIRPMRKSGSYDMLQKARPFEKNDEKIIQQDLWNDVQENRNSKKKTQQPNLMDLLNDIPQNEIRNSDENDDKQILQVIEDEDEKYESTQPNEHRSTSQKRHITQSEYFNDDIPREVLDNAAIYSNEFENNEEERKKKSRAKTPKLNREEFYERAVPKEKEIASTAKTTPRAANGKHMFHISKSDINKTKDKSQKFSPRQYQTMIPPSENSYTVRNEICRAHPNNQVTYICLKDNCGELLCPLCLYEHQKVKHIGDYENLSTFGDKIKSKLDDTYDSMILKIEKIVELQKELTDKDKFQIDLVEELNRIEESLIRNVKQFFTNLREEYQSDLFFDHQKLSEELNDLHSKLNSVVQNMEEDMNVFFNPESNNSITSQFVSQIIQKNYFGNSQEMQKVLNTMDQRLKHFINSTKTDTALKNVTLQFSPNTKSKLLVLLNESVKIVKKKPTGRSSRTVEIAPKNIPGSSNDEILKYYQELQKTEENKEDKESTFSRDIDPVEDLMNESPPKPNQVPTRDSGKSRGRSASPFNSKTEKLENNYITKKLTDGISNTVLEVYKTFNLKGMQNHEKDLDPEGMRFMLEYLASYYNNQKIKLFDQEFFQKLLNVNGNIDFSMIEKGKLHFENVLEFLLVENPKYKSIFTAHEKMFFVLNASGQWVLFEIRSSHKVIIIYDYIGKFAKSKLAEQLFGLIYEVIRFEYKNKLSQNPENFIWEKRLVHHPSLVSKNASDTGVLAVKILSNAYQNKEFTNNRISPNEVTMIRKKIEKIFKGQEDNKPFKFMAI